MVEQVKKSRSSASSSSSRRAVETPSGPDRLTRLPAELLDAIFSLLSARDSPHVPICKSLLPFQRGRLKKLRLATNIDPAYNCMVLSQCTNLDTLSLVTSAGVPAMLAALPHPERLSTLHITASLPPRGVSMGQHGHLNTLAAFGSTDADVAGSLARMSNLMHLGLYCPIDFSSPAMIAALHRTSLQTIVFGPQTVTTLRLDQLLAFVETLPFLERLQFDHAFGNNGELAQECSVERPAEFYDSWKLPEWPGQFPRADFEALIAACEAVGDGDIEVAGTAVEAMEVEDSFDAEEEDFLEARARRECQRDKPRNDTDGETVEEEATELDEDCW
ncbi:hypothetical protein JCM6882_007735 [Rhodosporidiobolus microsporus]